MRIYCQYCGEIISDDLSDECKFGVCKDCQELKEENEYMEGMDHDGRF